MSESEAEANDVKPAANPKEVIIAIGKKEGEHACEYCAEADDKLKAKPAIQHGKVPYEFVDVDTDRGEEELNEVKLSRYKGIKMPVIKRCDVPADPNEKRKCEVSQGYEDEDYYDLDNFDP